MAEREPTKKGTATQPLSSRLETSSVRPSQEPRVSTITLPEPGAIIAEKYRVDRLLAQGGMGAVYAATHVISGKRVALKWMLPALGLVPGADERFVREARATARIDHPNVVDIYDVGQDRGSVYLVMEFLRGETLHERMTRTELTPRGAVALLMPALRGVAAAHSHGVIHRDLKPDNIFLCQGSDGEPREPKVLDFGISKIAAADELRNHALTHSGMVMGTPYYMSPEQARGANQVDARSDVYAFGVILYELLTKRRPFEAETYNQLMFKIATEDAPPIGALNPHVDPELVAVVERAMARDPAARIASVEALGAALEPFAGGVAFRPSSSLPGELVVDARAPRASAHSRAPKAVAAAPAPVNKLPRVALAGALACVFVLAGMLLWRAFGSAPRVERRVEPDEHEVKPRAIAETAPPRPPAPSAPVQPSPSVPSAREVPPAANIAAAQPVAAAPPAGQAAGASAHKPHATRANQAEQPSDAPKDDKLPADWDERLSTTPNPANATHPPSAGGLSESDLK